MAALKKVTAALQEKMNKRETQHEEIAKIILARLGIDSNERRFTDDVVRYVKIAYQTGLWDYENFGLKDEHGRPSAT